MTVEGSLGCEFILQDFHVLTQLYKMPKSAFFLPALDIYRHFKIDITLPLCEQQMQMHERGKRKCTLLVSYFMEQWLCM